MLTATAEAMATVHVVNAPAVFMPFDMDRVKREIEKLFAQHVGLLSENRPEGGLLSPISFEPQRRLPPGRFSSDDLLDWDAAIEAAPRRPSGTLTVTLQYAGRATPSPTTEPWD